MIIPLLLSPQLNTRNFPAACDSCVREETSRRKWGKKEQENGENQRRSVKDKKIEELTEIREAKRCESPVCGVPACVCVEASSVSEGFGFTGQGDCGFPRR